MRAWHTAALLSLLAVTAAAAEPDGQHVTVTAEMCGAGIVSSGVKLPPAPPATGTEQKPVVSWGKPLPYPIVIADRRNNRLIEIAPNKRIVWEFPSPTLSIYRGNDDVYFAPDGKSLMVNEEDNYDIHIIDYTAREIAWRWGKPTPKAPAHCSSTSPTTRICSNVLDPMIRRHKMPVRVDVQTYTGSFIIKD
jgi:hypothetical protein